MIEKGRHTDLDRLYRNCPLCIQRNVYILEDEYHFLMVCPEYEDLRYNFFPENMLTNVNLNKFYSFMTSKNEHVITSLAKYLFHAFQKRKSLLE